MPELDFDRLRRLVGESEITPMPGGASTRRYFRLAAKGRSLVAMFVPDAAPEEIGKDTARARWPFLEVRELLEQRGIDVPRLEAEDCDAGWVVLEDLGDDTLANVLSRDPSRKTELYMRAIHDLAQAQEKLGDLPAQSVVRTRAFDEDLLRWEIDHFREWGVEARGHRFSPEDRRAFDAIADRLARTIASWPRGFVHRDYQSRNLMVRPNGALSWIDFQDALMGPRIYDAVALLNDSYQEFDRAFVVARLGELSRARGVPQRDLEREFDTITVQRKLKDAGRFVFIDRKKGNPSFLPFVVPTIRKVRASLERLAAQDEDMRALGAILARALPAEEWAATAG